MLCHYKYTFSGFSFGLQTVSGLIALLLCWILLAISSVQATSAQRQISEAKAKSVLLYNFIKHIRWPDEENRNTLKVAFLNGDNAFFKAFKPIAAQTLIRNKSIDLRVINSYKDGVNVDVLVIPAEYNRTLENIAVFLAASQTLLVTDGAKETSAVMINYLHPSPTQISFEVNRSNIIFEKLSISKDILLYGGSETEIVTLYKEIEKRLLDSKAQLVRQKTKLQAQAKILQAQSLQIDEKNAYIDNQKADIQVLNVEQSEIKNRLNHSTQQLYLSQARVDAVQKRLIESRKVSVQLADQIKANAHILAEQKHQIRHHKKRIGEQNHKLGQQEDTITSQRSIIFLTLCALLLVTLYIIVKQKLALGKERTISDEKTKVVKSQEASIDAYKSSLQVKNDFLTTINHELRTPMHLIMGALQGISSDDKDSLQHSLGIVEDGAEQMMLLISDILFYSELQSEQFCINPSSVDIKYQLIEVCELHRPGAESKGLGFYLYFSRSVPEYLNLDVERVCMVVEKLLDNAVKYTHQGEIVINVDWKVSEGPKLLIQIDDSGVGFSEAESQRAFMPFDQADNGLERGHGGLGIGLSISEKLMRVMGGEIRIESKQGSGSSLHLQFPAPQAHHDEFANGGARKSPALLVTAPDVVKLAKLKNVSALRLAVDNTKPEIRVLVVEDNSVSQLVVEKIIKSLGHQCLLASDGLEALQLIAEEKPDLVLMDVQMPNMSGIECTRHYRQSKNLHQPFIVALTANPLYSIQKACLDVGMDAVLSKPIDTQQLQGHINRVISDRDLAGVEV